MSASAAPTVKLGNTVVSRRSFLLPLALAQFICSFAGSNMNVMISDISRDLDTTVKGVQTSITLFLLIMAILMIPASKLTDRWGRKRCFMWGLVVYGVGAVLCAVAPGLGVLILGNSVLEGVGTALLIPPVYILTTMAFTDVTSRARAFGAISGMAGVGAATGPLIGGAITTAISWRASFVFQALVIVLILWLGRGLVDPVRPDPTLSFDIVGAVLSAAGMLFLVTGILQAGTNNTLTIVLMAVGAVLLLAFYLYIRHRERAGRAVLLSTRIFKNKTSDLGLVTQNVQWLILLGVSFVLSVFLQEVRGYNAVETGGILTSATLGLLLSSLGAERFAKRRAQRTLIVAGFVATLAGMVLLVAPVVAWDSVVAFLPGLFVIGLGVGLMLTPSVNVVQSSFPEDEQGEISGLSRSVSNLGSSLGTAIAGTILASDIASGNRAFGFALLALAVFGLLGLAAAWFLPAKAAPQAEAPAAEPA